MLCCQSNKWTLLSWWLLLLLLLLYYQLRCIHNIVDSCRLSLFLLQMQWRHCCLFFCHCLTCFTPVVLFLPCGGSLLCSGCLNCYHSSYVFATRQFRQRLYFQAVRRPRLFILLSCCHDVSWTTWTVLIKLTGNIHQPILITWSDSGGQRSRSQQAVEVEEVSTLALGGRSSSSSCNWIVHLCGARVSELLTEQQVSVFTASTLVLDPVEAQGQ